MTKKLSIPAVCLAICMAMLFSGIAGAYEGSFPVSTPDVTAAKLRIGGTERDVLLYRPPGVSSPALLILLSGTGSDLTSNLFYDFGSDNMRAFAAQEGVVIATPIPRMMTWGDWDNHSEGTPCWETATQDGAVSSDPDVNPDLMLLNAVMDEAVRAYGADSERVYLLGFSNGAFFSYFAAAVLNNRVAAFAESGGGLVLSNTTAGEPTLCQPTHISGIPSEAIRTCTELGWTPQTCSYTGAVPRPIDPAGKKVPPGFLSANDNDDTVPFAHTCNLVYALQGITDIRTEIFHFEKSPAEEGGHGSTAYYLENAWNFMKNKRLNPGSSQACFSIDDTLAISVSCALYNGIRYGFTLNYAPVEDDPTGFYWKMNIPTFSQIGSTTEACMSVSNDLKLNICAEYHGIRYEFALNYNPVSSDPAGVYWKADISTFKQRQ